MFSRMQHSLKTADSRRVKLTSHVHDELNLWRYLVHSLGDRLTHIRERIPCPPTWTGMTDASLTGMGGICHSPKGEHFVLRTPVEKSTAKRLLREGNPTSDLTINDL